MIIEKAIIYNRTTRPTALRLAEALGINARSYSNDVHSSTSLLVGLNWGCSSWNPLCPSRRIIINDFSAVGEAVEKDRALERMKQRGVPVPTIGKIRKGMPLPEKFPVYLRQRRHSKGKDIMIVNSLAEFDDHFYEYDHWTEGITGDEYRVHVMGGDIIYRQKKLPEDDDANPDIRNRDNGWKFVTLDTINQDCADAARQAVHALGLDFGAVDVMRMDNGEARVFEVNSAPGIEFPPVLEAYTTKLKEMFGALEKQLSTLFSFNAEIIGERSIEWK